ncbi:MAG: MBL fold metallo-hydrolase [Bacilli bacterium]|jgi:phosphoribosyl 1,2-cyclic phosphodiesterase|nr:MBL fold metallo-hydrolase [Bacilli bacterium]MCH4228708.1 MBL fold metallo-hydrolase [Bacilli bacterium]MCH4278114.1 MBL fold metallo-hydrolase [Bacilli bacterium]
MIRFLIVASGSKGNATLIYSENTLFQIDMGISLKRVKEGLSSIKKNLKDVSAVLLTHEHSDHIGTIGTIEGRIPIFASEGTYPNPKRTLIPYKSFRLGDFIIEPIQTSHDANNPVGFIVYQDDERLVYVTDTGYLSEENLAIMKDADYYIIESNHDLKMLLSSRRPAYLKQRIHSDVGHLSNADSAFYMASLVSNKTKGIYLAHLSEECNAPEVALRTYREAFTKEGLCFDDYHVVCAKQWESVKGGDL